MHRELGNTRAAGSAPLERKSRAGGPSPTRVAIGLGANRGRRARQLASAIDRLGEVADQLRCSRVYETLPEGGRREPPYLNLCCVGKTRFAPDALLDNLHRIEGDFGRPPPPRIGGRVLDLDLLLYGGQEVRKSGVRVPHPRMMSRNFVLLPLAELVPSWIVPGTDRSVGELAEAMSRSGVMRVDRLDGFLDEE